MAEEFNIKDYDNGEAEARVPGHVTINVSGGTQAFNIYERDPELMEVLSRIEKLLREILNKALK